MVRLRSSLLLLFVGVLLSSPPTPLAAQSVDAVVDQMRANHKKQLQTVDTYIVETNLYTAYNEKVTDNGRMTYRTETKMKGNGAAFASTTSRPAVHGLHFDRLKKHASYEGTDTVNGTKCHVLQIDDAKGIDPEMQNEAASTTYFIHASDYVPTRMLIQTKGQGQGRQKGKATAVTIDMKNYKTVDGLTLPHRMEIQYDMDMSKQEEQQMQQMLKKMEDMPAQQRQQMKKMMGGQQMEMMKQMMSGDPVVVEVQDVKVNVQLPDDVF